MYNGVVSLESLLVIIMRVKATGYGRKCNVYFLCAHSVMLLSVI